MAIKTDEEIFNDYLMFTGYAPYDKESRLRLFNSYDFKKYILFYRWNDFIQSLKTEIAKYFKKHLDNK